MRWHFLFHVCLAVLILSLSIPISLLAGEWKKPKGIFALKFGILGKGKAHINNRDESIDKISPSYGFFLVFPVYRRLHIGPSVDLYFAEEARRNRGDEPVIDAAFNLKVRMQTRIQKLLYWPTLSVGYAFPKDKEEFDNANGITTKVSCDVVYQARKNVGILGEIGVAYSPHVNYNNYDVTAGPLFILRGGLLF